MLMPLTVLILVLVEIGLGEYGVSANQVLSLGVLILVLVEIGLGERIFK